VQRNEVTHEGDYDRDVARRGDKGSARGSLFARHRESSVPSPRCVLGRSLAREAVAMTSHSPSSSIHWHEALLGRSLAAFVHPMAAWQSRARTFRVLLVAGYFAMGYVTVLAAIALL